jgi:hypothetical protein
LIPKHLLDRLRRRGQAADISDQMAADTHRIGAEAQRLLDDPILKLAFQTLSDEIVEKWKVTALGDTPGREKLYALHAAMAEVDAKLRAWVGEAKVEQ